MNEGPQAQQQTHPAVVAQEFMKRADMKGGEVEAYAQTFNWLQALVDGELVLTPKEAYQALLEELKELRDYKREIEGEEAGDLPVLTDEVPAAELEDVDSEASD